MKFTIEIDDKEGQRVCPCERNGKHDHAECVRAYIESGLIGTAFQRELTEATEEFKKNYKRPGVSVTASE